MSTRSAVEKPARKHKRQKDTASAPGASLHNADRTRISKKANAVDANSDAPHGFAPIVATNVSEQSETAVNEKKHKKRRHVEQEEAIEERQDADEPKKKKKRKHAKDPAGKDGTGDLASAVEASVSKDEKGKKMNVDAADAGADEGKGKHAKEARRNQAGEATAGDSAESPAQAESQKPRKSKKDKKRKKGIANAEENEEDVPESGGKHDKKKRKHRSSLPNPSEDGSLSEHARKGMSFYAVSRREYTLMQADHLALQYAFTQFDDTSSWKFNKARQNWLIRNVSNDEVVSKPGQFLTLGTSHIVV